MGFFDRFKKKKELTPAALRETMAKLKNDLETVAAIEDVAQRENAAKGLLIEVEQTKTIVQETLTKVEADIKDLEGRDWWATQEAVNSDLRGLRRGKQTLLAATEELEKMSNKIIDVLKGKVQTEPGQTEPGQSEPGE
ncbi:MAG: hypothetical protein E7341_04345 [Clostridiales bacterium]|nr:hypothetical protein [Clostridiales bacterium]